MKINLILAAAVASLILLSSCDEETPQARTVPVVVVEPVIEMEFADSVTEIGEVQAYDTVHLSANVSGFLTEANFKEGDLVKKGSKLFQIDPAVYEAAVNNAEADVNKCNAELTNKKIEFERQKTLLKANTTSRQNFETAEMALRVAEAELKSAEAGLAEKKVNLSYTRILAPFDGYVGFKNYSVGNMVGPSSGALATITSAGNVKIFFSVDELTVLRIYENYPKPEENTVPNPELKVVLQNGKESKEKVWLSAWNNRVQDGTFRAQATAENAKELLGSGMYVKVVVQVSPLQKRVMVKQSAILREQLGDFVYVVDAKNRIERRKIVVGSKNGAYRAVISGLHAGENVVVDGLQKAGAGDEVKPITPQQSVPGRQLAAPPQENAAVKESTVKEAVVKDAAVKEAAAKDAAVKESTPVQQNNAEVKE